MRGVAIFFSLLLCSYATGYDLVRQTYRAAVYEHNVTLPPTTSFSVPRSKALEYMMPNLQTYKTQAGRASQKGADIIIFPEDGIYGMDHSTRASVFPYLEYIPDPKSESWNPCTTPSRYPNSEVQNFLSCLARNNSIYIVANFGDKQTCSRPLDNKCPADGHYQYNTNIVYDPTGLLIAKYHKVNLYYEFQFDYPRNTHDVATFNTPFGRFGLLTCFDILFQHPALDIISRNDIGNIAFPTAWMDALPFLAAVQFHSAFAAGLGVNLLAANIHLPTRRFQGSGLYTPNGAKDFYYDAIGSNGKLLVADVPIISHSKVLKNSTTGPMVSLGNGRKNEFQAAIFHDTYNLVPLLEDSEDATVCHNNLCCNISYSRQRRGSANELYALGALDGLHSHHGDYHLQICILVRCSGVEPSSCAGYTKNSDTVFNSLKMYGNFSTPFIYPEILLTDNGTLHLSSPGDWTYSEGLLKSEGTLQLPLVEAGMIGRVYEKDRHCTSAFLMSQGFG